MLFKLIRAFFRPAFLSMIGSGIGILSGLNSMGGNGGGPSFSGAGNSMYTPYGMQSSDSTWQALLSNMYNQQYGVGQQVEDPLLQSFQQQMGINQQPLIGAGQQAGQQYGGLANMAGNYAGVLGQQAGQEFGAGQQVMNMGMDPRNQLHDFMQQQVVDNSRASSSARGIGMSPYAGGMENDATRNFNMDWQNQQLGRANTGLQAMNSANQAGATDLAGSMAFGAQAPQYTMQGAATPISAQQQAYGAPAQYATQYAGNVGSALLGPEAGIMGQVIPYLNGGYGAGSYAANAGLAGAAQQNQFGQQGLQQILAGMQNLQSPSQPGNWLQGFGGGGVGYGSYAGSEDASAGGSFMSGAW